MSCQATSMNPARLPPELLYRSMFQELAGRVREAMKRPFYKNCIDVLMLISA